MVFWDRISEKGHVHILHMKKTAGFKKTHTTFYWSNGAPRLSFSFVCLVEGPAHSEALALHLLPLSPVSLKSGLYSCPVLFNLSRDGRQDWLASQAFIAYSASQYRHYHVIVLFSLLFGEQVHLFEKVIEFVDFNVCSSLIILLCNVFVNKTTLPNC